MTPSLDLEPRRIGILETITVDSLALRLKGSRFALPLQQVSRIELSQGFHGNVGKGILIGILGGAAIGAVIAVGADDNGVSDGTSALAIPLFGVLGMPVGAVVGAATKSEDWKKIALESLRAPVHQTPVAGERPRSVFLGQEVRLHTPHLERASMTATLRHLGDSTISIARGKSPERLPRRHVVKLEIGQGSRRHGGLGAGFLTGVIISGISHDGTPGSFGLAYGSLATPVGFGVGSLFRSPRWEPVPLDYPRPEPRFEAGH